MCERVVHFLKRMDDEVRRRLDHLLEEIGVAYPALRILPIGRAVCEFILIDDDEDVIVRTILVGILRCLDPIAAGVRAEKDDLENPAVTPCANGILRRGAYTLKQNLHDNIQLALLALRRSAGRWVGKGGVITC